MIERFAPLPPHTSIFRMAEESSHHLKAGADLPDPSWLEPSSDDKEDAVARERRVGISAWDHSATSLEQACAMRGSTTARGFLASCEALFRAAQALEQEHTPPLSQPFDLAVVSDPADQYQPQPGWEGHCLIEGLERPPGLPGGKLAYKALRLRVLKCFKSML